MHDPDSYRSQDLVEVRFCPLGGYDKCHTQCRWWDVDREDCVVNLATRALERIAAQATK